MIVSTTSIIEGHHIIEYKGIVQGIVVRSPSISQGIKGAISSIVGGSIGAYIQMCEQ
ncbi:MAG: hypothetical protein CSYNP_03983 [Syntrophus sp. SKADARSKE-3]|nr:hypothetical protein [Syntrophus sp. SKADARSKE-3]